MLERLLQAGYNIDTLGHNGWTPLFTSLWLGSANGVRALWEHGASLALLDERGRSVLHIAAQYSPQEIMAVLEGKLAGLDPDLMDKDGKTAMEYFSERQLGASPVSTEHAVAFEKLITSTRIATGQMKDAPPVNRDVSEDEIVFFDAQETL